MSIGDALGYFVYSLLAIMIVALVWIFRQRMVQQAQAQRMADAAFEMQVLKTATAVQKEPQSKTAPFIGDSDAMASSLFDEMPIPTAEAIPARAARSQAPDEDVFRQPADVACAAVINQLRNAGIVEEIDGFLELNGNAKAAVILRMKGGKHALVLPYFETEPFALRNLRRYDMIIQVGRNGKAVVMRSIEEVIASKVAGSMI